MVAIALDGMGLFLILCTLKIVLSCNKNGMSELNPLITFACMRATDPPHSVKWAYDSATRHGRSVAAVQGLLDVTKAEAPPRLSRNGRVGCSRKL